MIRLLTVLAQAVVPLVVGTDLQAANAPHAGSSQPIVVELLPEGLLRIELGLDGGSTVLELTPAAVRAPDYRVFIDAGEGQLLPAPPGTGQAFVGLSESGNQRAVVGFDGERLLGSIRDLESGVVFDVQAAQITTGHAVVQASAPAGVLPGLAQPTSAHPTTASATVASALTALEVAADLDFEAFIQFGSNLAAAELHVITVLAQMNDEHWNDPLETDDPEISNRLTALVVRTSPADPFSSNAASTLLFELSTTWSNELAFIPRDTVQLFTGRNLQGGTTSLGFIGGLCSPNQYSLVEQSAPTLAEQAVAQTFMLGTQWGLSSCEAEPDCDLMCNAVGCGDGTGFGATSLAALEAAKLQFATCLDVFAQGPARSVPTITTVQPTSLEAVVPGDAELLLSGSGFLGTTAVTVGGIALDVTGSAVAVLDDQTLRLRTGELPTLGSAQILVTNALGTGSAAVAIVPNSNPVVDLVDSLPATLSPLDTGRIYVGSGLGDTVFLLASKSSTPSVLPGLVALELGNNFSQLIQLGVFLVDASTGYVEFTAPLINLPPGTEIFVQAATVSATAPALPAPVTNLEVGRVL